MKPNKSRGAGATQLQDENRRSGPLIAISIWKVNFLYLIKVKNKNKMQQVNIPDPNSNIAS